MSRPRACAALVALSACSGSHSQLAREDATSSVSTGAGGGAVSSSATAGGGDSASSSSSNGSGGEAPDAGPTGPTELTLVNGVADYDAVRFCFMPYPDGDRSVMPWPADADGMPFAGSAVVDLDGMFPEEVDIQPHAIGGDLRLTADRTCAEILTDISLGQDALVERPLPVVPASSFRSGRSMLWVATGCLGGPGHTDSTETLGCGEAYTESTPTASLVVVGMSRQSTQGRIAFQIAHASPAVPTVDIRLIPGFDGSTEREVVADLSEGAILPTPPFADVASTELGVKAQAHLRTYEGGAASPTSDIPFATIFDHGPVDDSRLLDGSAFTFVAIGGRPGVQPADWWQGFTYVLVPSDPPSP